MELNKVLIKRKRKFISNRESWTRPLSVEKFVNYFLYFDEREAVISDRERVKFVDKEKKELPFDEGYKQFKVKEQIYLDQVLRTQQIYFKESLSQKFASV